MSGIPGNLPPAPGFRPKLAGFHSHGMLGTYPDLPAWDPAVGTLVQITQVITGPLEAFIMGALLTSQVLDIAIGAMTPRGTEGRRARH